MNIKIQEAKELMENGWRARENLEFNKAKELLLQAKGVFENEEDWFNVTECLNHLAYNEKLQAMHHNLDGIKYAEEAEEIANKHNTERKLILRTLMSLASSAGLFERALHWSKEAIPMFTKDADKADIFGHAATFNLRTGDIKKALENIEIAEDLMGKGFDTQNEPHRSIWKSKLLLTKALISFNNDDIPSAKRFFEEGYKIAKDQNLKTRIAEAEALKPLFE